MQITEEHKSLWRIKNEYMKDASKASDCKVFWVKLAKDKETHIKELEKLIRKHM
ncbi:MAG: hypothetical protein AAB372_00205 [Patescibacteria group bacterium]